MKRESKNKDMVLFSDNSLSNSDVRKHNIRLLETSGFNEGGLRCRSGEMRLIEKATKSQLVFGVRSNISGKGGTKYWSLSKDFATKQEAIAEFKSLKPLLCAKDSKYAPALIY